MPDDTLKTTQLDELAQAARWGSRAGKSLTREWPDISEFARERWRNVARAVLAVQAEQNRRAFRGFTEEDISTMVNWGPR